MKTDRQDGNLQIEIVGRDIRRLCLDFVRSRGAPPTVRAALDKIRELIEYLPLASDDFGLAICRIENAVRYCQSNEFGAAKYEIRLLLAVLGQQLVWDEPDDAVPRRQFGLGRVSEFDRAFREIELTV